MAGYICVTLENGHCFDINPQGLIIDQAPYIANGWVGCQVENSRQGTRLQIMAKNGVRWHSTQMIVHVQPLVHPLERHKK